MGHSNTRQIVATVILDMTAVLALARLEVENGWPVKPDEALMLAAIDVFSCGRRPGMAACLDGTTRILAHHMKLRPTPISKTDLLLSFDAALAYMDQGRSLTQT